MLFEKFRFDKAGFIADEKGNIAIMTAVSLLGIVVAAGAAIDYSRLSSSTSNYQQAADAAVLAASKKRNSMTMAEMTVYARKLFDANLNNRSGTVTSFKLNQNDKTHRLTLDTKGHMETSFIGLVGIDSLDFDIKSQVALPGSGLEVALVLDNTDSMDNDGKIGALKVAANNFVDLLMPGATNNEEKLKIGVVPFGNYVNVGKNNRNRNWINVPDDYEEEHTYRPIISSYNCHTVHYNYTYEGRVYTGQYQQCDHNYGPEQTYTRHYRWKGCVGSREYPFNINDKRYNNKKVQGLLDLSCTSKILPLTHRKDRIKKKIAALTTTGRTYIPAGITWGRRVLSKNVPFRGGSSRADILAEKTKQVLVLMTDGQNTRSKSHSSGNSPKGRNGAYHWGTNLAEANSWTAEACTYVKSQNIELFTVTFGSDLDDATRLLMRNCATDADHYFDAANGEALNASFQDIANSIRTVYLSQ